MPPHLRWLKLAALPQPHLPFIVRPPTLQLVLRVELLKQFPLRLRNLRPPSAWTH